MKKKIGILLIFILFISCTTSVFATGNNQYVASTKIRVNDYNEQKVIFGFDLNNNEISINNLREGKYFTDDVEIKVYDINENEIQNTAKGMGTGTKIKLYQENNIVSEYSVIIYGDVSGDGKITAVDALALIKAINKKIDYITPLCKEAGKIINKDKDPTAIDALAIIKHLNKQYVIEQSKEAFYWDYTSDVNKDNVVDNLLKFRVIALDKDGNEINNVKWIVSEGTLDKEIGTEVNWTIPEIENTYKITATLNDKKVLEKEIRYLDLTTIGTEELADTEEIEINENDDEDLDGLTNKEEKELGTDIFYNDSDADGINDYEEVKTYNTNPLLKDSDDDGIEDINEIKLGMNPLVKDSDGDGTEDLNEKSVYEANNEELGIKMKIEGNANIVDTEISSLKLEDLNSINAIVSPVYDFNTSGSIKKANVSINYDETVLSDKGINEQNLSLYYFDPTNYTFEEVETTIDIENNTANAILEHFSMYVLADKNTMVDKLKNQIMFIIDNSGSMYTYEQAIEKNQNSNATTEDLENTPANDPEFKRLDTVSYLIDNLDEDFEFGISKFTGTYTTLSEIGASKENLKESLEKIKTEGETFDGTFIGSSLYTASFQFSSSRSVSKHIVLISDGKDNAPSSGIIKDMAIETLKEKGIRVITIGIGNQVNKGELREYAEQTGGMYYQADSAKMLTNIYGSLSEKLNFGRTKIGNEDYLVVADSGFVPELNGVAFKNYRTSRSMQGQCFGIAKFCQQYFNRTLKSSDEQLRNYEGKSINFNYNLSSLEDISEYVNLANYEFKNEAFGKLMLTTDQEKLNYDKLKEDFNNGVENLHVELKEEYKQYVEQTNGAIKIVKETDSKEGYGTFTYDAIYIDMDACTEKNLELIPDLQIFKAIEFLYMIQFDASTEKILFEDPKVLDDTIDRINNGDPVGISFLTKGNVLKWLMTKSNHRVNGIKVLRSTKDTNKYKLAIYDNRSPKETQYLTVEKVKSLFGTMLCGYEQEGHCTNIFVEK